MNIDYGSVAVATGITAAVIKITLNFLETEKQLPSLYKIAKFFWVAMLMLLMVTESFGISFFTDNFHQILAILVLYILYQSKGKSSNIRSVLITILPFTFALYLSDFFEFFAPKFYGSNLDVFKNLKGFTSMWLIGFGIYIQKYNKKEQARRQKEELERQILEDKKKSLEYQVAARTAELTKQKESLEKTVLELKTTQTQLIHAEKMASLGELTAGIAHEIQNPLNFVNNFSELSVDLVKEINEEIDKSPLTSDGGIIIQDREYFAEILKDLIQNQEKIAHHGKRASSIVKGMLEHSRTSTGIRELTDINALADEYLRLSYHGLRAKDKNSTTDRFNANFELIADPDLPKINVVSQDIGRVLLNLINNAFQSQAPSAPRGGTFDMETKRQHKVVVKTQYMPAKDSPSGGWGAISITDNGSGIPTDIKAKIFQPFFTTKPTGQGTGLGLSLAYDIVTKGHGGTLEVESVEGEGTTFVVRLPII